MTNDSNDDGGVDDLSSHGIDDITSVGNLEVFVPGDIMTSL